MRKFSKEKFWKSQTDNGKLSDYLRLSAKFTVYNLEVLSLLIYEMIAEKMVNLARIAEYLPY